jgi:hypothetical protein
MGMYGMGNCQLGMYDVGGYIRYKYVMVTEKGKIPCELWPGLKQGKYRWDLQLTPW